VAKGILAKKLGMTQIFTPEGRLLPVTVVEAASCRVLQIKTVENDGYNAVQLGVGPMRKNLVNSPLRGHFNKTGGEPVRFIRELRLPGPAEYQAGQEISVDVFSAGDLIDVTGVSKGKGFAGGIKRHNFHRGLMSHGSKSHREPGSIGSRMSGPGGRVFKGKKLPGRMGGGKVTVQRLTVVKVDKERSLILIKGAIPGPKGAFVLVRETVKPLKAANK
jgi:large subunit ribosomal protein L3